MNTIVLFPLLASAMVHAPAQDSAPPAFTDPAPPTVATLVRIDAPPATEFEGLVTHRAPAPLPADAVTHDWPAFLGPRQDGVCRETGLADGWPDAGPPALWEHERGEGYASPAVVDGRVVFTHRTGDETHVDCLDLESGRRFWRHSFRTTFVDEFIRNGGPRATPLVVDGTIFVHAIDGRFLALELETGRVFWQRDLTREFGIPELFFGVVASPIVRGKTVIVNLGARGGPCVAAFDRATGRLVWGAGDEWSASCASPVIGRFGGRERLLVLTGGKSRPPTGGLIVLDPDSGAVDFSFPFRSRTFASVNGASPVALEDGVLLTASYGTGSVFLDDGDDGRPVERWRQKRWGLQFSTPLVVGGALYAVEGAPRRAGSVVRLDPATGEVVERNEIDVSRALGDRTLDMSVGEGALLALGDDRLLCLGDTGLLVLLAREEQGLRVVAHHAAWVNADTWTPPVVSRGILLLAQNSPCQVTGSPARLVAYDLRARGR